MARIHRGLKKAGNIEAALSHPGAPLHDAKRCTVASGSCSVVARRVRFRATRCTRWPAAVNARATFSTRTSHGYSPIHTLHTDKLRAPGARPGRTVPANAPVVTVPCIEAAGARELLSGCAVSTWARALLPRVLPCVEQTLGHAAGHGACSTGLVYKQLPGRESDRRTFLIFLRRRNTRSGRR